MANEGKVRVWVVYGGEAEAWYLCGVFSSKELAEAYIAKDPDRDLYGDEGIEIDAKCQP